MSDEKLPPSRTAPQFIVRFPEGMREQIAAEAKSNNRSINAEIIERLMAVSQLQAENETLRQRCASFEALWKEAAQRQRALEVETAKLSDRLSRAETEARQSKEELSRSHEWSRGLQAKIERDAIERQNEREAHLQLRAKEEAEHRREVQRLNAQLDVLREEAQRARSSVHDARVALEIQVNSTQTHAEMLAMRGDLLRLRLENLTIRQHAISAEAEALAATAKTDEDFARAEAKVEELREIEQAVPLLARELETLVKDRESMLARMTRLQGMLRDASRELESRMKEYKGPAAASSEVKPVSEGSGHATKSAKGRRA